MSEELVASAISLGFNTTWITTVVEKYGDEALAAVVEAARQGLHVNLIVEVLDKFGADLLFSMVDLLNQKKMSFTGDIVPGPVQEGIDYTLISALKKYLPIILPELLEAILNAFLTSVAKPLK